MKQNEENSQKAQELTLEELEQVNGGYPPYPPIEKWWGPLDSFSSVTAVAGSSGLACSSMRANGLSLRLGGVRQAKRPTADGGSTSETWVTNCYNPVT